MLLQKSVWPAVFRVVVLCLVSSFTWATEGAEEGPETAVAVAAEHLQVGQNPVHEMPVFRENWILGELRSIRNDMMEYRNDMNRIVIDRELEVADKAMGYATSTVTYFFYLIAAAASLLALAGWSTIRDLKDNIRVNAEKEVGRLTREYESRLADLEQELQSKSSTIAANQEEIERTNEIHRLWLKAGKEPSPEARIRLYDHILELRPDDAEAIAWKADAVLELGEHRWALSLCDHVLEMHDDDAHALYQRACAWVGLGEPERALDDLEQSVRLSVSARKQLPDEEMFEGLAEHPRFKALLEYSSGQTVASVGGEGGK